VVLRAAKILAVDGIGTVVVKVHTLKPLDVANIAAILERTGAAVTIEDHSIIGGLGSAIAEVIAENMPSAVLVRVGLRDIFPSSGDGESLLDYYGMSVPDIVEAARRVIRKRAAPMTSP
jgi:transketolase